MRAFIYALIALLVLASGPPLLAQTFQGSIRGAVRDAEGGVLPGATILLTNEGTGAARTAVTNERGEYNFANLAPADYALFSALNTRTGCFIQFLITSVNNLGV